MIFDLLVQCKSAEEMAEIMSHISYGCGDCSPDSREQCEECLKEILSQDLQDFLNS